LSEPINNDLTGSDVIYLPKQVQIITMTAQIQPRTKPTPLSELDPGGPKLFVWTVDQYLGMVDQGYLSEDDKTELLAGNIIYKMAAKKPHDTIIGYVQDYFTEKYFKEHTLRSERGVKLSETSMPQPDYVVAVYREDKYKRAWPTPPDILLLVEVSDSTLRSDRGLKRELYATAGIKEYWIINIPDRQIELYLNPDAEAGTYSSTGYFKKGKSFESPFVGTVIVDNLIPDDLVEDE